MSTWLCQWWRVCRYDEECSTDTNDTEMKNNSTSTSQNQYQHQRRETPTETKRRVNETISSLSIPITTTTTTTKLLNNNHHNNDDDNNNIISSLDSMKWMATATKTRYHVVPPMHYTMGATAGVKVQDMQW